MRKNGGIVKIGAYSGYCVERFIPGPKASMSRLYFLHRQIISYLEGRHLTSHRRLEELGINLAELFRPVLLQAVTDIEFFIPAGSVTIPNLSFKMSPKAAFLVEALLATTPRYRPIHFGPATIEAREMTHAVKDAVLMIREAGGRQNILKKHSN